MGLTCVVLALLLINQSVCSPGEPVIYLPPLELRTVDMNNRAMPMSVSPQLAGQFVGPQFPSQFANSQFAGAQSFAGSQFVPSGEGFRPPQQPLPPLPPLSPLPPQHIHHTTPPPQSDPATERPREHHNFTVNEFVDVLNEIAEHNDGNHDSESRAAEREYESPPPPYSSYPPYGGYSKPYGPPRPSYGPPGYGPPSYGPPGYGSYGPPPPADHPHKPAHAPEPVHTSKTVKPLLTGLLKPVTTKVASKVSGLIGLVLTLLTGSSPDDLELKGFKDIVINGIVKPLLVAKGGIKSLISKLSIPVISLLLINLEVLITVWWLWEECPEHTSYSYPKPPTYNYNNSY